MKKTLLLLVALLGLMGTAESEARMLSPQEALQAYRQAPTGIKRAPVRSNPELVYTFKHQATPTIYVFSENASSDGFLILSASDEYTPLIGYSDKGDFNPREMPENMKTYLEMVSNYIASSPRKEAVAHPQTAIAPLLSTTWNQGKPYNNLCPELDGERAQTGCVATAIAQIMKYYNYPTHGIGSDSYTFSNNGTNITLTADYANTTYDWASMLNSYSANYTDAQATAVATLMYQIGVAVKMQYGRYASSSFPINSAKALVNTFGYDKSLAFVHRQNYTLQDWENLIYSELAANRPVSVSGSGAGGGHQFVCDGYDGNGYFHFNWGWGGLSDGYFLFTGLNPSALGTGGGTGGGFNSDMTAVVNIKPDEGTSSYTTNITMEGNLVTDADSYNRAQNDKITIGNPGVITFYNGTFVTENNITLGLKLTNVTDENDVKYVGAVTIPTLEPNYGIYTFKIYTTNLPVGTWKASVFYSINGERKDVIAACDARKELELTVTQNLVSVSGNNSQPMVLHADYLTQAINLYAGKINCVKFRLTNQGTQEYYGGVKVCLANSSSVYSTPLSSYTVNSGEEIETQIVGEFKDDLGAPAAGEYSLYIVDQSGAVISDPLNVTLQTAPTEKVKVTSTITMAGIKSGAGTYWDPYVLTDPDNVNLSIDLTCTQGLLNDYVSASVFQATYNSSSFAIDYALLGNFGSQFVSLPVNETSTLRLSTPVTEIKDAVYIIFPLINGSYAQKSKGYFKFDTATGIDAINESSEPARYYDLTGREITNPANGIFIRQQGERTIKVKL